MVFAFRFVGWSLRWSLATLFFIAVMAGAGYYVFHKAVVGGEYVIVPNIVNLPITEASALLWEHHLDIGRQREMPSDQVPEYHVIAQRPEAGRVVRAGQKVFPTVSQGVEALKAPNLVGKTLDEVETTFAEGFRRGTTAVMTHSAPRNTVIAQDPAPGRPIARAGEIHLLVSDGATRGALTMPDLVGLPVQEAVRILAPLRVNAVANRVDQPSAAFDTVLAQTPPPGTVVHEGMNVMYDVRASGQVELPDAWRKVVVEYTVPEGWFEREVRIDVMDRGGRRMIVFPKQSDYEAGVRAKVQPGKTIRQPLSFRDEITVEVYVDGVKARTYQFQGDLPPVVTDHDNSMEEVPLAES